MKVQYKAQSGRLIFEVEGETPKALFSNIAAIQEVFDAERVCGVCGCEDIRFLARKVDDFDFYELACQARDCRARFAFGQAKKGGSLFPKRKDDDNHWLPNGGWAKWEGGAHTVDAAAPPVSAPRSHGSHATPPPAVAPPARYGDSRPAPDFRRELPEQLVPHFKRIQQNRNQFGNVCAKMLDNMLMRDERLGKDAYDAVLRAVDCKFPRGITEVSDMREVLIDLWEAAESLGVGEGLGV